MAQLIEAGPPLPSQIHLTTGDVLLVKASGGHLRSGFEAVEMLGVFSPAILRPDGSPLSPMGSPNTVLFLAKEQGRAAIDVVTGDPFFSPQTVEVELVVDA